MVLEFPPSAFLSSFVSEESLNGTRAFLPADRSANATAKAKTSNNYYVTAGQSISLPLMTFPRVDSDLLMAAPSCRRAPVAPVDSALSLYTSNNFDVMIIISINS